MKRLYSTLCSAAVKIHTQACTHTHTQTNTLCESTKTDCNTVKNISIKIALTKMNQIIYQ